MLDCLPHFKRHWWTSPTPVGHEQVMALAGERGMELVSDAEPVPREDLAFLLYLEQHDLFQAARSLIKSFVSERRTTA